MFTIGDRVMITAGPGVYLIGEVTATSERPDVFEVNVGRGRVLHKHASSLRHMSEFFKVRMVPEGADPALAGVAYFRREELASRVKVARGADVIEHYRSEDGRQDAVDGIVRDVLADMGVRFRWSEARGMWTEMELCPERAPLS